MKRISLWGFALVMVLVVFAVRQPAMGQQITASITGTVEDSAGAALNDATVTARDTERGTSSSTKTQGGIFNFNSLPIGTYEVKAEAPETYRQWKTAPQRVRFPDGESLQDLFARTADVLRLVLERHVGETVVLVGHDSVNRALLLQLLDAPLSAYGRLAQDPATLNEVDIEGGAVRIVRVNDTSHLA